MRTSQNSRQALGQPATSSLDVQPRNVDSVQNSAVGATGVRSVRDVWQNNSVANLRQVTAVGGSTFS